VKASTRAKSGMNEIVDSDRIALVGPVVVEGDAVFAVAEADEDSRRRHRLGGRGPPGAASGSPFCYHDAKLATRTRYGRRAACEDVACVRSQPLPFTSIIEPTRIAREILQGAFARHSIRRSQLPAQVRLRLFVDKNTGAGIPDSRTGRRVSR
jgi:hypothetical protein